MKSNKDLIRTFYDAFARLDYRTIQSCYNNNPVFNDPVFGILQGDEVKAMWEMLCKNAKDFSLQYSLIEIDGEYATCKWMAAYTFSRTGKRVVNNVKAYMRIQNNAIIEHTDEFDFYKWARQALGLPGILLGWSGYLKNKIRRNAKSSLRSFMASAK